MNIVSEIIVAILIGYGFGCFQSSYLLVKYCKNQDIRLYGSGNAGASNTFSNFGVKLGGLTAILDILKVIVAISIFKEIIFLTGSLQEDWIVYICGAMVIIGHMFPAYLDFRGGKGTASVIGMMLALDWRLGVLGIAVLVLGSLVTNYIVIGALLVWLSFLLWIYANNGYSYSLLIVGLLFIIVMLLHRDNFKRIKNGEEVTIRSAFKRK